MTINFHYEVQKSQQVFFFIKILQAANMKIIHKCRFLVNHSHHMINILLAEQ